MAQAAWLKRLYSCAILRVADSYPGARQTHHIPDKWPGSQLSFWGEMAWIRRSGADCFGCAAGDVDLSNSEFHVRRTRSYLGRDGMAAMGNLFLRVATPAARQNRGGVGTLYKRIAIGRPAGFGHWHDDGDLQRWESYPLLRWQLLDELSSRSSGDDPVPSSGHDAYVLVGPPVFLVLGWSMGRRIPRVLSTDTGPSGFGDLGYGVRSDRCAGPMAIHALA